MGRYYKGDIEGKFWFGVQATDDPEFFGMEGHEPQTVEYSIGWEGLPEIEAGILRCVEALGEYRVKLDDFFKAENGYNDKMVADYLKIDEGEVSDLLMWYARLELGNKILACVKEKGHCEFEAEF